MKVKKNAPEELIISDSPRLIFVSLLLCSLAASAFVVDGVRHADVIRATAGLFGSGVFFFFGAYAITFTEAAFSRSEDTIRIRRNSLLKKRGEQYPLNKFLMARVHSVKNSKGKSLYAVALAFEALGVEGVQSLSASNTVEMRDIRGFGGLSEHEYPLLNYADSWAKDTSESMVSQINAWRSIGSFAG